MNILFINPPNVIFNDAIQQEAGNDLPGLPLGILYLSALAKKQIPQTETVLLDLQRELIESGAQYSSLSQFIDAKIQSVSVNSFNVCAISLAFNTNGESFSLLAASIKSHWPECVLIIGGPIVSGDPYLFLNENNVDFLCIGEGEISFCAFLNNLQTGSQAPIQGIYQRHDLENNEQGSTHLLPSLQPDDLDSLPFPDYSLIFQHRHSYQYGILTSRGCPNRCAYCSHSIVTGKKMRFRSTSLVLDEIRYLHLVMGATALDVFDSNVGLNKKPFLELLSGTKEISSEIELSFNPEITHLTIETLTNYHANGLNRLVLSIESGSPHVLTTLMLRRNYLNKARDLVQTARDLGMDVRCLFVLGMLGETPAMQKETLEYAKSLAANWCTFYIATPVPGSKLYHDLKAQGFIHVQTPFELSEIKFRNRNFDLPGMTASEIMSVQDDFEGQVNFVGSYNVRNGHLDTALAIYQGLANRFNHRIRAQLMILYIYELKVKQSDDMSWKLKHSAHLHFIQQLLSTNPLARQEFERYSQKSIYKHLFELLQKYQST